MAKTWLEKTDPLFERGDRARVEEAGLAPWEGDVINVKWSNVAGWYVDVLREDVGVYSCPEANLIKLAKVEA